MTQRSYHLATHLTCIWASESCEHAEHYLCLDLAHWWLGDVTWATCEAELKRTPALELGTSWTAEILNPTVRSLALSPALNGLAPAAGSGYWPRALMRPRAGSVRTVRTRASCSASGVTIIANRSPASRHALSNSQFLLFSKCHTLMKRVGKRGREEGRLQRTQYPLINISTSSLSGST